MRSLRFSVLIALAACADTPERPPDDFARAAQSWVGFAIGDMIRVWGPPDSLEPDHATWRLGRRSIRCINITGLRTVYGDRMSYTSRECSPIASFPHKCTVTAALDPLGEILETKVYSYRCAVVYGAYIRLLDSGYPYNLYKYGDPLD